MIDSRRDFLRFSVAGISALSLPQTLFASSDNSLDFDDYKALVVIYQGGGNDGLNTFIPCSDDAKSGYPNYAKVRDVLRIKDEELSLKTDSSGDLILGKNSENPYFSNHDIKESYTKGFYTHTLNGKKLPLATNPLMPELAHLVNKGKVAIIANVGNIIQPSTKSELLGELKPKPPFLYAHNHQTKLTYCGEASSLSEQGWAGRLYDEWSMVNHDEIYGLNISFGGPELIMYGNDTEPLVLSPYGPVKYNYPRHWQNEVVKRKRALEDEFFSLPRRDLFQKLYTTMKRHSYTMQDILVKDWEDAKKNLSFSKTNAYGEKLFSKPSGTTLGEHEPSYTPTKDIVKFEAVARMAYIGKTKGLKRQIFFIYLGGYDTHSNQTFQHARNLRALSLGIGDLDRALSELGLSDKVTIFNISDFGRSTGNNGDGTDHAWGSNTFVLGGAVKGGVYGKLPDLSLGSDDDLTKKGRLIPTTSMSQLYATIVRWFGADEKTLDKVFYELKNFSQRDLNFMI